MSYPFKMLDDSLCDEPTVEIAARQLLGTVCVGGGADCPLFKKKEDALEVLELVKQNPAVSIRLTSDADRVPHYSMLEDEDFARLNRAGVLDRKRDLDVLQRLGLSPGDVRRARYLYELLLKHVETPDGICAHDTPGWEGCDLARGGAYESVREKGWKEIVYDRTEQDMSEARRESIERIRTDEVLNVRPHHLMCMSCWVGSSGGDGERSNDTLDAIWRRICDDPDLKIRLVEGNCEACHCCDGYHAESTRCVHTGGLLRDYKKDLDVFQRIGKMPGDIVNAREILEVIYEEVTDTTEVCGYGTGEATSNEWSVCSGPTGNVGFAKARKTVVFDK